MLDSLEIKNFRNLKELTIRTLERVNLFTGRNNTGKSTILDAIALYASKSNLNFVYQLLDERGENYKLSDKNQNATEINIKALSALFTQRKFSFDRADAISIGSLGQTLFREMRLDTKFVALRFVKYYEDDIDEEDYDSPNIRKKRTIIDSNEDPFHGNYSVGIEIQAGNNSHVIPLTRERPFRWMFTNLGVNENFQYIRTRNIDRETNGKLWDSITLTKKENYVINALKIIEPKVERVAFIEEASKERNAVIKLAESDNVLPIKSMGDGINRILTIILALVNCDNGFLLIDEFENGLHYSVQEKLWEIIFKLAKELNVQVFATTHSEDCIYGFENVLNNMQDTAEGKLIRLDYRNGQIQQVEYDANELKIASEQHIETR